MNERLRAACIQYGLAIPVHCRYTILCRWRPPKDQWKVIGSRWRDLAIVVEGSGDHNDAAIETCLFLISNNRGTAVAHHVLDPYNVLITLKEHVEFNWSWYDGVVTYGIDVVSSSDLVDGWDVSR